MDIKPTAWMNPNCPSGIFARHEEGAKNFGCTVELYTLEDAMKLIEMKRRKEVIAVGKFPHYAYRLAK